MSQVVLITGCSTGIGRDLAQRLTQAGYTVVATARRLDSLDDLQADLKLPLDVTLQDSVDQAVEHTLQRFGRVDVLVNNAGYAVRGAVEEISDEQVYKIFDVNVFGVMRMLRSVVPHMRKQAAGRIINIGSLSGKLVIPVNGAYAATKFALEALSDALRLEVAPFGIQVVLIEPGNIKTSFPDTALAHAQEIFSNPASPYLTLYRQYHQVTAGLRRQEPGPEVVSRIVQQAMEAVRPKARYLVAFPFPGGLVLYLGDSVWDLVVRRMFKITP
jgi:NAD(P)-dependent dehydrogenase (short-subunit alcohol dehydrogenase family)